MTVPISPIHMACLAAFTLLVSLGIAQETKLDAGIWVVVIFPGGSQWGIHQNLGESIGTIYDYIWLYWLFVNFLLLISWIQGVRCRFNVAGEFHRAKGSGSWPAGWLLAKSSRPFDLLTWCIFWSPPIKKKKLWNLPGICLVPLQKMEWNIGQDVCTVICRFYLFGADTLTFQKCQKSWPAQGYRQLTSAKDNLSHGEGGAYHHQCSSDFRTRTWVNMIGGFHKWGYPPSWMVHNGKYN